MKTIVRQEKTLIPPKRPLPKQWKKIAECCVAAAHNLSGMFVLHEVRHL